MSTRTQPPPWGENADSWAARTRVVLQPIAPPSILGLFAFAGATFIVAAHLAGWYGTTTSPEYLFPFAAIFGGVAQFAAGMWAYRARDGLATAMHGMWGSFWMAYGILFLLVAVGAVTVPASGSFPELGYWFLALGVITAFGALAALAEGVDLIVAGRCSDSALYAALPISMGLPHGLAWHAGKVLECGTSCCEKPSHHGVVLGIVRPDEVIIRPYGPALRCTPQSVAAHSLYENADPFRFTEASGVLDLTATIYEQADDTSVRIRGSVFEPASQYTIKLEGAELVGYQSILIGGIRDPYILGEFDAWLDKVKLRVADSVHKVFGRDLTELGGRIDYHVYGRDGVMGALEPERGRVPHEVGIVVEATAPDQATATALVQLTRQPLLHQPTTKWKGSITGFACLHNPSHVERGPVYQFNLNHVVLTAPQAMFRTRFITLEGAAHAPR